MYSSGQSRNSMLLESGRQAAEFATRLRNIPLDVHLAALSHHGQGQ